MAQFEDGKFIIINKKHLNTLNVPKDIYTDFIVVLNALKPYLPDHQYIACNQDEPYAPQVIKTILEGEDQKAKKIEEHV